MGRHHLILLLLCSVAFGAVKADIVQRKLQRKIVPSLHDELKQQLAAGDISKCHQSVVPRQPGFSTNRALVSMTWHAWLLMVFLSVKHVAHLLVLPGGIDPNSIALKWDQLPNLHVEFIRSFRDFSSHWHRAPR